MNMSTAPLFKDDRCYRPDEVAEKLAISKRTVYRYVDDGLLRAVGLPGATRIRGSELNKFMDEKEKDPMGMKDMVNYGKAR